MVGFSAALRRAGVFGVVAGWAVSLIGGASAQAQDYYLNQMPRITGIAFSESGKGDFKIASPFGIFAVAPDGLLREVSNDPGALFEYVADPQNPNVIYSSGYRTKEEKLGVVKSEDGGKTWRKISNGGAEPEAFVAMTISASNPKVLYGVADKLMVSRDAGATWEQVGDLPSEVLDLAVAADDPAKLYIATRDGLKVSTDSGKTWSAAHPAQQIATLVRATKDGAVYAFLHTQGLFVKPKGGDWQKLSDGFAPRVLFELAVDPTDPQRMMAAADTGAAVISTDGGKTWRSFEGIAYSTPERIAQGKKLYEENCIACHGEKGIGEKPGDPGAKDEDGQFVAPALDDSMHGWHHADAQLIETIMEGSPRNERMIAWKHNFERKDAESLVAYIKSLWNFNSIACQGPRHMQCMH